ncbi:MAG: hypothetical protein BGO69_07740 [Bacteroidetes bacterium 46-16]|nr:MAG: hypothetical protein BGO69_07740 [Bacteroidetes bacterium 46-16]
MTRYKIIGRSLLAIIIILVTSCGHSRKMGQNVQGQDMQGQQAPQQAAQEHTMQQQSKKSAIDINETRDRGLDNNKRGQVIRLDK